MEDYPPSHSVSLLAVFHHCAIVEPPTDNDSADYALYVDGHILGIVEAKKLTLGPLNVLTQTECYPKSASAEPPRFA